MCKYNWKAGISSLPCSKLEHFKAGLPISMSRLIYLYLGLRSESFLAVNLRLDCRSMLPSTNPFSFLPVYTKVTETRSYLLLRQTIFPTTVHYVTWAALRVYSCDTLREPGYTLTFYIYERTLFAQPPRFSLIIDLLPLLHTQNTRHSSASICYIRHRPSEPIFEPHLGVVVEKNGRANFLESSSPRTHSNTTTQRRTNLLTLVLISIWPLP